MLFRKFYITAACIVSFSQTLAAETTIPINFIGDWCYSSEENTTANYKLPSWTENGICKKILSIQQYGFHSEGKNCEPIKIKLSRDTAPSGTGYTAIITARCQPDGPPTEGKVQTFEFYRYKGNLYVTPQ